MFQNLLVVRYILLFQLRVMKYAFIEFMICRYIYKVFLKQTTFQHCTFDRAFFLENLNLESWLPESDFILRYKTNKKFSAISLITFIYRQCEIEHHLQRKNMKLCG